MGAIELNEQFKKAISLLEASGKNVFITGKAGTGKSTLLEHFRSITQKNVVVLAPTGVAALNVNGETIHSFFGFKPGITLDKVKTVKGKKSRIFKSLDAIVIDEISMVRADLLDCVDKFLRLNGKDKSKIFGGVQMVFVGDLYQLPPVVTSAEKDIFKTHYESPYFFSARCFRDSGMEFVELEKIYRQKDRVFIGLLNAIRNNTVTEEALALLNRRRGAELSCRGGFTVHLTTTNAAARAVNIGHLNRIKAKVHTYPAEIFGEFNEKYYPTELNLRLAAGAQVMFLNNDSRNRWVNGTIGKIKNIRRSNDSGEDNITVELPGGRTVEAGKYTWEIFHFVWDDVSGLIRAEEAGSFTQYPLRLAWAVTIHKSQGKTFDRVIIDMGRGAFAHGQTYVALSRCRALEGISLKTPIKKSHIFSDWRIVKFMTRYQYGISERDMPLEEKLSAIKRAIKRKGILEMTYLKSNDEKSRRRIRPLRVGEMAYAGKPFIGVSGFCFTRQKERVFRVDRILEMGEVE